MKELDKIGKVQTPDLIPGTQPGGRPGLRPVVSLAGPLMPSGRGGGVTGSLGPSCWLPQPQSQPSALDIVSQVEISQGSQSDRCRWKKSEN